MKPDKRFEKKVWRKPPKAPSRGQSTPKKSGFGRCAICNKIINSSKRIKIKNSMNVPKSQVRTNRPYGGYLCHQCLRKEIIRKTQELSEA
ncbi:MAG: hypothetical protein GF308_09830 [Candidatus Heimdallarchaeota archaeon]|nr:hypothetical protein [Candidatus Heimdallarchaeota archaeon]